MILLQMNARYFSKNNNQSDYSHWYKRNILTKGVSQINVYTVEKNFQQSSKLKFAEGLIVRALSGKYYITKV